MPPLPHGLTLSAAACKIVTKTSPFLFNENIDNREKAWTPGEPKRNQTNVAILGGDLLVCLPEAAQRDGSTTLPHYQGTRAKALWS